MVAIEYIQPYLNDYSAFTGTASDKFIDPLTLDPCEPHEVIKAHIINQCVPYAYNETVPVKGEPDHFYGSRVEPSFIEFLTFSGKCGADLLKAQVEFDVKFRERGPTFRAFIVKPQKVEEVSKHLAVVPLRGDGDTFVIGLRGVKPGAPEVPNAENAGRAEINWKRGFLPAHWVASMLKVGHLTMFKIFGYRGVFDPSADAVRRVLAQYYYDRADSDDAPKYFRQFENAVRVIGYGTTFDPATYVPVDLDTLRDKKFLAHMSLGKRLFAMTAVYKLSDKTISVTLPQAMDGGADIAWATSMYNRVLNDDPDVKQTVHLAHFGGKAWHMNTAEIGAHYQPQFESLEVKR